MPRHRPATSGYARIAQAEEEEEEQPYFDHDQDDPFQDPLTITLTTESEYQPLQSRRKEPMRMPTGRGIPKRPRRTRANSGVDIKAINARLERWADEIKERFTRRRIKGKSAEEQTLEIHHTVFQPPDWIRPATKHSLEQDYDDSDLRLSTLEFDDLVESVRTAIELGMQPKLISQGSSGSYFARNSGGKVVGVFKPKDEEPYASKNPKWTKWVHRNLLPFAFGRACLIPNLSYVSEAAAYILDVQLRTNIVPYTGVVSLSSNSFFYGFWDRRKYRKRKKPLPEKQGSFQVFLKGFKGATEFFREHPWPDEYGRSNSAPGSQKKKRRSRWDQSCRPSSTSGVSDEDTDGEQSGLNSQAGSGSRHEFWTEELQESFREELEKLVVLDYIMRNTDRGLDNWMIRIDKEKNQATIVLDRPGSNTDHRKQNGHTHPAKANGNAEAYHGRNESMTASLAREEEVAIPRLGAIDNSLSWPWKHPDAWRSYPFGWLFLPVSLIGRPFSQKTREHFLPLLTSKEWWSDTQMKLRKTFELDADFKERMFARQMGVMKGQAWNVVETLKTPDHGPLELTRRSRVCVWDDLVDIPVAVHLPGTSAEMRRVMTSDASTYDRRPPSEIDEEDEEMDISAALESQQQPHVDLLGISSPTAEGQQDNPFNHVRQRDSQDNNRLSVDTTLTPSYATKELSPTDFAKPKKKQRPNAIRSRTAAHRMPYDESDSPWKSAAERRRRFSFGGRRRTDGLMSPVDIDDDGDLGYAAANEQQNVTRKVIVERLEMVKGKPPVFSWC